MDPPREETATKQVDLGEIGRTLTRIVLTVGAAVTFSILVVLVCYDVWTGGEPEPDRVYTAVTISLSITFGSAFVGWLGVSQAQMGEAVEVKGTTAKTWRRRAIWPFAKQLFSTLPGAAIVAMFVYLIAGALAGITYVLKEDQTPTVLVAVATAWAAQTSAIIAATLASGLQRPTVGG